MSFLESGHLLELGNLRTWPHKKGFSMNPPLLLSLGVLVTVGDCRDRSSIARDYQLGGAESSDHSTDTSSKLKNWKTEEGEWKKSVAEYIIILWYGYSLAAVATAPLHVDMIGPTTKCSLFLLTGLSLFFFLLVILFNYEKKFLLEKMIL